jgi:iron complex outermembrane receptor protein
MYNRFLLTMFLWVFSYTVAIAQQATCNVSLRGNIRIAVDTITKPANAASITIPKLHKNMVTDSIGNFVLAGICPGKLKLIITYEGFKTLDTTVYITPDDTMVNILLVSNTKELNGVTVVSEVIHKDQITTAVKTTLSGKALDETRGLSLGESLKGITGLNSIQTGPSISKPVIHGLYGNRILIMNNGVRQEGQTWGNDHAPEIDPFVATNITVIKGAASIRYGSDAIGGVILLDPKAMPVKPGIAGEVNIVGMTNGKQALHQQY